MASPGHEESWRSWLQLSNLLAFKQPLGMTIGSVLSNVDAGVMNAQATQREAAQSVGSEWQELLADATEAEKTVLLRLAAMGLGQLPEVGYELEGFVSDLAWPEVQVALATDDDVRSTFESAGWTTTSNVDDIQELLKTMGA